MESPTRNAGWEEPTFPAVVTYQVCDARVVVARGDLDVFITFEFGRALDDALASRPVAVLVDLRAATFMDAAALAVFIGAMRRGAGSGTHVRLTAASPAVRQILGITSLTDRVPVEEMSHDRRSAA